MGPGQPQQERIRGQKDINQCRYAVFCAKKGEAEPHQLPPCRDYLHKHCQRANYQAVVWKNSPLNNEEPSPVGKGWVLESDESSQCQWLEIQSMSGMSAPRAVIELMACTCKRLCDSNTCDCILNGLKCSNLCRLTTCSNQPDENEDLSLEEDEDIDHDLTLDLN
ncbi:hypothetical protein QZH41_012641 [Actinostola sp. cb2023]|nr:hypothetical protein QZH41_012641 [Actinostola sp. cb2023]